MVNFPISLDNFTNPTQSDRMDNPVHSVQHTSENDAIEALEAKVGVDSSAVTTSHDYKLSGVSGTDKAASKAGAEILTNKIISTGSVIDANATVTEVLKKVYPIGSIYISTVATNPATVFGFGTWSAFGAGKTIVGLDSGDTDFDTAEKTGGEKAHTLTANELPAHTHPLSGLGLMTTLLSTANYGTGAGTLGVSSANTGNNSTTGSAHNNLQPYIVTYMWKRVS